MRLKIHILDAFTETQFKGNSAAVIITKQWLSESVMQSIAIENNLSETAFLVQEGSRFHIRWFSPITEIDFCGHATLAASSVVFSNDASLSSIKFFAHAVGELTITKGPNGDIQMDFPNTKPQPISDIPTALVDGLSIKPESVLCNQQAYFAVYADEEDVLNVTYDEKLIRSLAPLDVVVTAPGKSFDCVSRYFWPANGGDEDPVTGSVHTGLAPYWADVLGKKRINAFQASARGGVLLCEVVDDRVKISGKVVSYLSGEIVLQG